MTRSDLIAALEAATGPSREFDRHIARAFGWHRVEPRHTRNKAGGWIAPGDFLGTYSGGSPVLDSLHGTTIHRDPPRFTGSLDDAMTLVPSGWEWLVSNRAPIPDNGRAYINNGEPHFSGGAMAKNPRYRGEEATAATPAIALVIACLRALPEAAREREAGS